MCGRREGQSRKADTLRVCRRRGPYQSYLNIVYGVASSLGAALGGVMADTLGWRWEFGVQVPPLVLLFAVAAVTLPPELGIYAERESFVVAMKAFDFRGSLLLATSTTFLILGLNLGGNVLPCKFRSAKKGGWKETRGMHG